MASSAESSDGAANGLIFMREMLELVKNTRPLDHQPLSTIIPLLNTAEKKLIIFPVATAQFGKQLHRTQGVIMLALYSSYFLLVRSLLS